MADVLIVDDDPAVLELLQVMVEQLGHDVRTAASAEEGLLRCAEQRPDLLLLDLMLPGRDGDVLLEQLQRGLGRPRSLVVVSARPVPVVREIAERFGARHLHKPFPAGDLHAAVTAALDEVVESLASRPRGAPLSPDDDLGVLVDVDLRSSVGAAAGMASLVADDAATPDED